MENKEKLLEGSVDILDTLTEFINFERGMMSSKGADDIFAVSGMQTDREKLIISLQGAITRDNAVIRDSHIKALKTGEQISISQELVK